MHTYIYICISISIYSHIYVCTYKYMKICRYILIHAYTNMYLRIYTYIWIGSLASEVREYGPTFMRHFLPQSSLLPPRPPHCPTCKIYISAYTYTNQNRYTWLTGILANITHAFTLHTIPSTAANPAAEDLIVSVSLAHSLAVIAARNASHIKCQVRQ